MMKKNLLIAFLAIPLSFNVLAHGQSLNKVKIVTGSNRAFVRLKIYNRSKTPQRYNISVDGKPVGITGTIRGNSSGKATVGLKVSKAGVVEKKMVCSQQQGIDGSLRFKVCQQVKVYEVKK